MLHLLQNLPWKLVLHLFFPKRKRPISLHPHSNPCSFSCKGRRLLGEWTSGEVENNHNSQTVTYIQIIVYDVQFDGDIGFGNVCSREPIICKAWLPLLDACSIWDAFPLGTICTSVCWCKWWEVAVEELVLSPVFPESIQFLAKDAKQWREFENCNGVIFVSLFLNLDGLSWIPWGGTYINMHACMHECKCVHKHAWAHSRTPGHVYR